MGVALVGTISEVVSLVTTLAPQLINDVEGLSTLYSNASDAVQNAADDGTVAPADWAALKEQEQSLQTLLNQEVQAATTQASSVPGAAQP